MSKVVTITKDNDPKQQDRSSERVRLGRHLAGQGRVLLPARSCVRRIYRSLARCGVSHAALSVHPRDPEGRQRGSGGGGPHPERARPPVSPGSSNRRSRHGRNQPQVGRKASDVVRTARMALTCSNARTPCRRWTPRRRPGWARLASSCPATEVVQGDLHGCRVPSRTGCPRAARR